MINDLMINALMINDQCAMINVKYGAAQKKLT